MNQIDGKTDDWINVFVLANYGTTADGKPVYPEWKDKVHASDEEIEPITGRSIIIGWDFGLTPAAVVCQMSARGQLIILEEFIAEDMGIREFAPDIVKPTLIDKYSNCRWVSVGDQTGSSRAQTDTRTCFQELFEIGIATEPRDTNDFLPRRESVAFFMNRMVDGGSGFYIESKLQYVKKRF